MQVAVASGQVPRTPQAQVRAPGTQVRGAQATEVLYARPSSAQVCAPTPAHRVDPGKPARADKHRPGIGSLPAARRSPEPTHRSSTPRSGHRRRRPGHPRHHTRWNPEHGTRFDTPHRRRRGRSGRPSRSSTFRCRHIRNRRRTPRGGWKRASWHPQITDDRTEDGVDSGTRLRGVLRAVKGSRSLFRSVRCGVPCDRPGAWRGSRVRS
jgi:hypothetical protein